MEPKKCAQCGNTQGNFIEKEGIGGKKAYFCENKSCYDDYKKSGEEQGVCEFC